MLCGAIYRITLHEIRNERDWRQLDTVSPAKIGSRSGCRVRGVEHGIIVWHDVV